MTLSLDDVRNKRFRMARKGGYEVLEVDEFVDEVEESFAQLFEENANLKKQVDALKSSEREPEPTAVADEQADTSAPQAASEPAPVATPAPQAPSCGGARARRRADRRHHQWRGEQRGRPARAALDRAGRAPGP